MTLGDKCLAILRDHGEQSTNQLVKHIWPDVTSWTYPTRRSQICTALLMLKKYGIVSERVEYHRHEQASRMAYWRIAEGSA